MSFATLVRCIDLFTSTKISLSSIPEHGEDQDLRKSTHSSFWRNIVFATPVAVGEHLRHLEPTHHHVGTPDEFGDLDQNLPIVVVVPYSQDHWDRATRKVRLPRMLHDIRRALGQAQRVQKKK